MSSCVPFISLKSCKTHMLPSAVISALSTAFWFSLVLLGLQASCRMPADPSACVILTSCKQAYLFSVTNYSRLMYIHHHAEVNICIS